MKEIAMKYYWDSVVRRLPMLLVISLILTGLAYAVTLRLPTTYQVHFSYLVSLADREASGDYRYDGYYALQATDLFTATLAKWSQTPEVIVAAYKAAGLKVPSDDPRQIMQHVETDKSAPQLVHVIVKDSNRDTANKLTKGLQSVMEKNLDLYHEQGTPALKFRIVPTESWSGVTNVDRGVISVATFIFTLFVSINLVLFVESLRAV